MSSHISRTLVIGGTGKVGAEVVSQLADRGADVRAMVRNLQAGRFPPSVEVVHGDLSVPETLDGCVDGVDAVFLVWCALPATVPSVLERIKKRASRIVFLSSPYKTAHPLFQASQPNAMSALQAGIEGVIEASGLEWTFLRPGMFAANARMWWAPQIRAGDVVRWPYIDVATAPIHERDIAAVAVRALLEEGHAGAEYVLTGPQSLPQSEQVSAIGRAIGRRLRVEEISPGEARCELLSFIPAPAVINMLLQAWAAAAGQPALVTSTFQEITGRRARTFQQWACEHAADFHA